MASLVIDESGRHGSTASILEPNEESITREGVGSSDRESEIEVPNDCISRTTRSRITDDGGVGPSIIFRGGRDSNRSKGRDIVILPHKIEGEDVSRNKLEGWEIGVAEEPILIGQRGASAKGSATPTDRIVSSDCEQKEKEKARENQESAQERRRIEGDRSLTGDFLGQSNGESWRGRRGNSW
jgi:hypothetical protein